MNKISYFFSFSGHCYIWLEDLGKKGSQQISTCLAKFISEEVPDGVEILNFYADNCAGKRFFL